MDILPARERRKYFEFVFYHGPKYILYIQYDRAGAPSLCAASREIPKQLNQALWLKNIPAILTSGTLMAGGSFDRPQKINGPV